MSKELHNVQEENQNENKDFLPIDELMAKDLPPISWLVDGIIPESGMTIMAAQPASFKTWFALQMAISIASGSKFLERFGVKQAPVLILDGESGERLLKNRMEVLGTPSGLPIYYQTYAGGKKFEEDFFESVFEFCAEKHIGLVIFDSLVRFLDAKDENSANDIANGFKKFAKLKDFGVSTLLIHHSRKNSGPYSDNGLSSVRGSGDIIASCDVGVILFNRQGNTITVQVGKNRYDEEGTPFRAKFQKESDKASRWYYLGNIEKEDKTTLATETILSLLANLGSINQKELVRLVKDSGVKMGEKKIVELLEILVKDGYINCKSGQRTEKIYSLVGELQDG